MDKSKSNTRAVVTGMGRENRYELRNKRKEVLELKLKDDKKEDKEVNGIKGRKKRAVVSTSTSSATSDTMNIMDRSSDLASTEMAFSIDHIREQIFRFLSNEDLYNCRLACRSWNSFSSLELQNRIKSRVHFGTKVFSQFLGLFDKRPESMLGIPLPCSKFSFGRAMYSATFLKNRAMLKFLNKYGPDIQELSFMCGCFHTSPAEEKEVIDFVTNLLLHQTPNLSKLQIILEYSASWVEGGSSRKSDSTLLATDPEFKEIHSKTWGTNSKLKVLSLTGVSAKLLEVVIQLAPNLREVNAMGYISNKNDCKYYMEPRNRLGHLKKIEFCPCSVEELEIFENVCELTESGDTSLKLREISFCFERGWDDRWWPTPHILRSPDMRARGENVINRLLKCSWNSLETIKWDKVTVLPGLKWPEVLPNVQKFTIRTLGLDVFPKGFSWSATFPKLRSLSLNDVIGHPDFTNVMDLLFQQQKVESVKDIHVHARENWSTKDRLTGAQFQRFQNIFPNAEIEISVPRLFTPIGVQLKLQKRCNCF